MIERNYPEAKFKLGYWIRLSLLSNLKTKVLRKVGIQLEPKTIKRQYKELVLWSSERGRAFPIKSWDDEYFKLIANSEFVLCPNGDHIWTYRFFEAVLCGAIPVIENYCSAYEGFRFRTIEEPINTMTWSKEEAEYNYNLCRSRLVIPIDLLQQEVANLLSTE